jgi:hypothetical protein
MVENDLNRINNVWVGPRPTLQELEIIVNLPRPLFDRFAELSARMTVREALIRVFE